MWWTDRVRSRTPRPRWVADAVAGHVLAAAEVDDGAWLALTRDAVVLVAEAGAVWSRPWHEVERGDWDGETHTLTIHWVGERTPSALRTERDDPRELPLLFRERVDASVVHVESEAARGGGTLRAAVRRTAAGELLVQVIGVGRVRPSPALEAQMDALEARVRDAVGM